MTTRTKILIIVLMWVLCFSTLGLAQAFPRNSHQHLFLCLASIVAGIGMCRSIYVTMKGK
jgi:hypothetical protein